MTPEEAYEDGEKHEHILDCPIKDESVAARRWVDGWYKSYLARQQQKDA